MNTCKAINCQTIPNKEPNISFHKFPIFDQELLEIWLENIAPPGYLPTTDDQICSLHFTDDQFMHPTYTEPTEPRKLIKYAIPSIVPSKAQNKQSTAKRKATIIQEDETDSGTESEVSNSDFSTSTADESENNLQSPKCTIRKKRDNKKFRTECIGDFKEDDLHSPEKMKLVGDIADRNIEVSRYKLKTINEKNERLKNQVTRLKNVIQHLKSVHKSC